MATLDEELENAAELASLKQQQRNKGLNYQEANQAGQKIGSAARKAANEWGTDQNSKAAAAGQKAGRLADTAAKMGAGSEAALAGAAAGALRGEGIGGVLKSAWSTWVLWFAFGFLTLSIILSPTIAALIPAAIALIYLDFHWVMSMFGFKIFGRMNLLQQGYLLLANLIVAIIPMLFFVIIYSGAVCGGSQTLTALQFMPFNIGTTITAIRGDFCQSSNAKVSVNTVSQNPPAFDDEAENRRLLASYGISVNKVCVDRTQLVSQTCVGGTQLTTLYEIIDMMQRCDAYTKTITQGDTGPPDNRCKVRVTGGSEAGHASGTCSHANGNKIDIGLTDELEQYIRRTSAFTPAGNRSGDPLYTRNIGGAVYARESDHWDISKCT